MENNQILLTDIPKSEEIEFTPLLPNYKKLLIIQWSIFYVFLLIGGGVGFYWLKTRDYITLLALLFVVVWLICFALQLLLIYKGFPYKGYAIRQKDIHYRSGYLTRKIITIPIYRIQHLEIRQGLISKILKIAKLKIYTAGDNGADLSIKGIDAATAENIKQLLITKNETNG